MVQSCRRGFKDVSTARDAKIEWATKNLPALGRSLKDADDAATANGDSVCAAMYLLRRKVPALGKDRLTSRIYPDQQALGQASSLPNRNASWKPTPRGTERVNVAQGDLVVSGLPDQLSVSWKGKELFRSAGFDAGGSIGSVSHADFTRPFSIEAAQGLISKLSAKRSGPKGALPSGKPRTGCFPKAARWRCKASG